MYYLVWKDTYTEKTNIKRFNGIDEAQKEIGKPAYIEREWHLFTYDENDNVLVVSSHIATNIGKTPFDSIFEIAVRVILVIFITIILVIILIYIMML